MRRGKFLTFVTVAFLFLSLPVAQAEVPGQFNYQGYLTDPDGIPIGIDPTAEVQMWFSIYDQEIDGLELWTEGPVTVTVDGGIFNVILGQINPITPDLIDGPCWLEVIVDGGGGGEYFVPRERIVSSLFAIEAQDADTVDGFEAATLEESDEIDADISAHATITDAHHVKTTSFADLTDTATDAQIPDDIMILYAMTAGDADTVDGMEGADLEESAEIDADVSSHGSDPSVHHTRYTNAESVAAGQDEFVNEIGDIITGDLSILGNVGIGTTSSQNSLDIYDGQIRLRYNGTPGAGLTIDVPYEQAAPVTTFKCTDSNDHGHFKWQGIKTDTSDTHDLMFIHGGSGHVGIGTTDPLASLHVAGDVLVDGTIAGYIDQAAYAEDADTVDGIHATDLEESDEIDDDISAHGSVSDVHHIKTTSFSELTDFATDAQIPDDITILNAENADKVDGKHYLDISVEIDFDIAGHASVVDAHHTRYTDLEAVAAGQDEFVNVIGDNITGDLNMLGKVGIGTVDPSGLLELSGADDMPEIIFSESNGADKAVIQWNLAMAGLDIHTISPSHKLVLQKAGGNVGIGTESPSEKLEVSGTAKVDVLNIANITQGVNDNNLYITGGNVGIGTESPSEELEVSGTAKVDVLNIANIIQGVNNGNLYILGLNQA